MLILGKNGNINIVYVEFSSHKSVKGTFCICSRPIKYEWAFLIGVTFFLTLSNNKDNNTHLKVKQNEMFIVFVKYRINDPYKNKALCYSQVVQHSRAHLPEVIKVIWLRVIFCVLVIFYTFY